MIVIGRDLLAHARIETAAGKAGLAVLRIGPGEAPPPHIHVAAVVLDLDDAGAEGASHAAALASASGAPGLAFFSHVDEDAGRAARAAGLTALPRGRFWREIDGLLEHAAR